MAPTKTKDAPRGTIHGSTTNSMVSFTLRAVPLPLRITSFLQANTSTMRRIQPDNRRREDDGSEDAVASKQLTTAGGGDDDGAKEVKPEEFWEEFGKVCDKEGREWKGLAERVWAFGPKRVGANLLVDRPEGRVKSSVLSSLHFSCLSYGFVLTSRSSVLGRPQSQATLRAFPQPCRPVFHSRRSLHFRGRSCGLGRGQRPRPDASRL